MNSALVRMVRDTPQRVVAQMVVGTCDDQVVAALADQLARFAERSTASDVAGVAAEFASAHRGHVTVTPARCVECRGRGWSQQAMRHGQMACRTCRGSRRGSPVRLALRPLPQPHAR